MDKNMNHKYKRAFIAQPNGMPDTYVNYYNVIMANGHAKLNCIIKLANCFQASVKIHLDRERI